MDGSSDGFKDAVKAAADADAAIIVLGDKSGLTSDCSTGESRDISDLNLPGIQQKLIEAVHATETPVAAILANGRSYAIEWMADKIPAILDVWLPG
jgi:beta-glucosidase